MYQLQRSIHVFWQFRSPVDGADCGSVYFLDSDMAFLGRTRAKKVSEPSMCQIGAHRGRGRDIRDSAVTIGYNHSPVRVTGTPPMTQPSPTPIEAPVRPGLHPRWQSDAALLKKAQKDPSVPLIAAKLAEGHAALQVYAAGDNPFRDPQDPQKSRQGSLCWSVRESLDHPYAYAGPPGDFAEWLPTMAASLWRSYWRWQIEWQLQCLPQAKGPVWLREAAYLLGKCLYAGWMTEARVLAGAIRQMYAERKLTNTEGKALGVKLASQRSSRIVELNFSEGRLQEHCHDHRTRHPRSKA